MRQCLDNHSAPLLACLGIAEQEFYFNVVLVRPGLPFRPEEMACKHKMRIDALAPASVEKIVVFILNVLFEFVRFGDGVELFVAVTPAYHIVALRPHMGEKIVDFLLRRKRFFEIVRRTPVCRFKFDALAGKLFKFKMSVFGDDHPAVFARGLFRHKIGHVQNRSLFNKQIRRVHRKPFVFFKFEILYRIHIFVENVMPKIFILSKPKGVISSRWEFARP